MKAWTQNLHMHSTFDDGKDSCRKMLLACRKAGLRSAGVCLHSPLPFPNDWSGRGTQTFSLEMGVLRRELAPFHVYTGIEVDSRSRGLDLKAFDYVIGAVHYLGGGEVPLSVDESPEISRRLVSAFLFLYCFPLYSTLLPVSSPLVSSPLDSVWPRVSK